MQSALTNCGCLAHHSGALHMGALTTCAVRHKLADGSGQAVVGATADGALFAAALLVDAQSAAALLAVQRALATELEHAAGLNPIAFRCLSDGSSPRLFHSYHEFACPVKAAIPATHCSGQLMCTTCLNTE